jgi:tRNA(Ile)-lysidine synthase TilS/MesJ
MKAHGKGKRYDCILGLSGGTDSSYLAWWAHQQGLRPLVVHMDNGWNSELAVKNIENICTRLGWDLHTHVIDWEEFRELQLAYLRAGVIDIEVLTDHAIYAIIYRLAHKYKIKYTLNGYNYAQRLDVQQTRLRKHPRHLCEVWQWKEAENLSAPRLCRRTLVPHLPENRECECAELPALP